MGNARYGTPLGDAGYDVVDTCHELNCAAEINRGLAHLCGDQPGRESEHGCGRWFCSGHLYSPVALGLPSSLGGLCERCLDAAQPEGSALR